MVAHRISHCPTPTESMSTRRFSGSAGLRCASHQLSWTQGVASSEVRAYAWLSGSRAAPVPSVGHAAAS